MGSGLKGLLLVLLVLLGLVLGGCASGPDLRVGIAPTYPPLAFMQDGVLAGIEPDLAQQLAKQTGRRIRFEIIPFDRLIPALQGGQIDLIMAGMSITAERQGQVSFAESYLKVGQMLLIREKDIKRFPRALFDQSAGVRIGVEKGSTGEQYALKTFAWGGVTHFDTTEAGVRALEQGSIDCFVHDAPTVWRFSADLATQHQGLVGLFEPLTDEPLAWAVRKNDPALLEQLNLELTRMRREGRLQEILAKWIRTQVLVRGSK
ncbi:transporter substrate-binding domain-containing protein [Trichlorobacter lovleyi]|uniref:transporter substrate-binding domain-containing protein n=1 Tax=Trichlorobacter lovleyi TaxID=313985 RepID=UPI00223F9280|nr:transporter substrate-binding domain-containing protein [Trichlorobacter lovleyi]QOX79390.1 transporter substrate-binding domain-containing protein [Trichlorobacter lovleyi]